MADIILNKAKRMRAVERSENKLLQFPGQVEIGESRQDAERREDARLLASIADRCPEALAILYRRRATLLYSLLVRMLVSETEAQEVMQDTFVQIWRRAATYDAERSSAVSWMIMIARGLAIDRMRGQARRRATHQEYEREVGSLAAEEITGAQQAQQSELAAACSAALHRLPEPQARVLQLAFFRGWTHEEIARAEGQPLGTIKARIRRGLLALRHALKGHHG